MHRVRSVAALLALAAHVVRAQPAELEPATAIRRVALLAGVNDGGPARLRLRYAGSDAQAFGAVLHELGGVAEADTVWAVEADRAGLLRALAQLQALVQRGRTRGARVEAVFYYSGHSDEEGLLLRGERLGYAQLRQSLEGLAADVKVVVLDSCASGALARKKGVVRRPPFLQDESARIRGMAILTSSAEDEVSQESERLRGSFFTHHLISALRGAADANTDGRVTLGEAYELAFRETLARTESTQGGVQHASYDMDLTGTGELVLTDLRASAAGLLLAAGLEGRIFVRDAAGALAAEVSKRPGARMLLGVPQGRYSVRREGPEGNALADITLRDGERRPLEQADFVRALVEPTTARGDAPGLRKVALNLSLFPNVSTNDLVPEAAENVVALGLFTRSAAVTGTALGLFGTWVDQEAKYFQASFVLNVARSLWGAQLAPAVNWVSGSVQGVQLLSLLAFAQADVRGVQLSPAVSLAGGAVRGFQFGGFFTMAGASSAGVQSSLGLNIARSEWHGLQLGPVNVAESSSGAQVGAVNVARRSRVQVGLVNVSEDVDGVPLGFVNAVRGGQLRGEVYADDVEPVNVAVKMGSRRVYSTIFVGGGLQQTFRYGVAIGLHLGDRLWTDIDMGCSGLHTVASPLNYTNTLTAARAVVGFKPWPFFGVFAGASANLYVHITPAAPAQASLFPPLFVLGAGSVHLWPGLIFGVRLDAPGSL